MKQSFYNMNKKIDNINFLQQTVKKNRNESETSTIGEQMNSDVQIQSEGKTVVSVL